jgi:crotonobetainyl-CoA:carnitine CoA-transferase CaiB-like acyl-CoA transferase
MMADLGAEVIKVEPPGVGDDTRSHGPFLHDLPDSETSGLFLYLNTNKLGITLNPEKKTGRELLQKLLTNADVFVESQPPGLLTGMGLDFETLHKTNAALIVMSLTPYGRTGPYANRKAYDINICALGGITNASGDPKREPIAPPLSQGGFQAGLCAAIATMIALFQRDVSGKGFHRPYPDEVLPRKDGYMCVDTPQNRQWGRLLELMGNPEWAKDPIFEDRIKTTDEYVEKADAYLSGWFMEHTKKEIFNLCRANQVPAAPVKTVAEVVNDPHLNERGYFVEIDHPVAGPLKYPGPCYQFSKTPTSAVRPAPRLGEHNETIYCGRLGCSKEDLVALRRSGVI